MNKPIWYIRRLSCMSIQEVIWRVHKSIQLNVKRFTLKDVNLENILSPDAERTSFYFDARNPKKIKEEFLGLFPDTLEDTIFNAERSMKHKFIIFNSEWNAGKTVDWHRDIITNKSWPLKYCRDIDFRNVKDGKDVRFLWEFNRHQHLPVLGKAYFLTEDKRYAHEVKDQIFSWIEQNPPYMGVNWSSPLEVSLRLISWCWAYKLIESSGVFLKEDKENFLKYLYLQAEFIKDNLSSYSSANNHLIGEACGLILVSLTFSEFKDSGYWLRRGKQILFGEILKQVHSDGVSKEQAFGYQGFVMELFLLAVVLLIKNDIAIPGPVLERFSKMNEFIMNIMDGRGNVPHIGDSDNARAVRLSENTSFNLFKSILSSASILSGRGDFKVKGDGFNEEHYLLFGMEGFKKYGRIKNVRPELRSRLFRKGGYALLRNKDKFLLMDCGDLGYGALAAHGHADLLSIILSSNGRELLIDPGTYLYYSGNTWRDYFRSTRAHNTITINGQNQSDIKGPFMWGRRATPYIERWKNSDTKDCISVSYKNCSLMHRREVLFNKKKEVWKIVDLLDKKGRNVIRQYFHLFPGAGLKKLDGNIVEVHSQGNCLYISLDKGFLVDIKEGEEFPMAGWSSNIFGTKVKSPTLVNTAFIEGRSRFNTLLYVSKKRLNSKQIKKIFENHSEG